MTKLRTILCLLGHHTIITSYASSDLGTSPRGEVALGGNCIHCNANFVKWSANRQWEPVDDLNRVDDRLRVCEAAVVKLERRIRTLELDKEEDAQEP